MKNPYKKDWEKVKDENIYVIHPRIHEKKYVYQLSGKIFACIMILGLITASLIGYFQ